MRPEFARKLKSRKPMIGVWMQIPHPMVSETLAQSGADFVLVDGEHGPVSPDTLISVLPGIDRFDMPVLYRVRMNATDLIKGALDAGVSGVMVPMVNSAAEAKAAIDAAKYPPLGRRGAGPWRAANYYLDEASYMARSNADVPLILQIETKEAVAALDEIAALKGFAALFVGPYDLCLSMGLEPGKLHPELIAIYKRIATAAKKHGFAMAIDVPSPGYVKTYRDLGFSLMTHGLDIRFLIDGSRQVVKTFNEVFKAG
jgi:4-hydroxy-2-oxoheptanedioate aldolase